MLSRLSRRRSSLVYDAQHVNLKSFVPKSAVGNWRVLCSTRLYSEFFDLSTCSALNVRNLFVSLDLDAYV